MCTAVTYQTKDFYFGRTLDHESSYGESAVIVPRNYVFRFRGPMDGRTLRMHYAMIGIARMQEGYPLFYDAVNEKGLCMAGLNFVGNAHYGKRVEGKDNVAVFEFIPWILAQCASVQEARVLLERINLVDVPFCGTLPTSQLHWMIADRTEAVTVESVESGLMVYENQVGALTNNPGFGEQVFQLNNFMSLSPRAPQNHFCAKLNLQTYSQGMGAIGLPGDLSSQSRFVRVAFTRSNSCSGESELESVSQFFHILGTVRQVRGCCEVREGEYEVTIYTSCFNADRGILYYTAYDNHQITGIDMYREDLNTMSVIAYPLIRHGQIPIIN